MSDPTPSRRLEGRGIFDDDLVRELLAARTIAVLATFDREKIHAVPMWFAPGDTCVLLATGSGSRKVRNLEADDRATLVIHDSRPGFEICGVSLAGRIEIVSGSEAQPLVERVHRQYVTLDAEGELEVGGFLASDDVALRFLPESALTWDERSAPASRALRSAGGALPLLPTDPRP